MADAGNQPLPGLKDGPATVPRERSQEGDYWDRLRATELAMVL